jgi:hypothetical protein
MRLEGCFGSGRPIDRKHRSRVTGTLRYPGDTCRRTASVAVARSTLGLRRELERDAVTAQAESG